MDLYRTFNYDKDSQEVQYYQANMHVISKKSILRRFDLCLYELFYHIKNKDVIVYIFDILLVLMCVLFQPNLEFNPDFPVNQLFLWITSFCDEYHFSFKNTNLLHKYHRLNPKWIILIPLRSPILIELYFSLANILSISESEVKFITLR